MAKRAQFSIPGTRFEKPEKQGRLGLLLFFAFAVVALALSVWLFHASPALKPLVCDNNSGVSSLTGWGQCHEAE